VPGEQRSTTLLPRLHAYERDGAARRGLGALDQRSGFQPESRGQPAQARYEMFPRRLKLSQKRRLSRNA